MAPLKYLSNVWKTLEMIFINSEINLVVPLSANCPLVVGIVANQVAVFAITDIKLLCPSQTFYQLKIMKNCLNN